MKFNFFLRFLVQQFALNVSSFPRIPVLTVCRRRFLILWLFSKVLDFSDSVVALIKVLVLLVFLKFLIQRFVSKYVLIVFFVDIPELI